MPKLYGSVNGETKQIKKLYGSVNGQAKEIKKLYGPVGTVILDGATWAPLNGPVEAVDVTTLRSSLTGSTGELYVDQSKTISVLFVYQYGSAYIVAAHYTDGTSETTRRFNGNYSFNRSQLIDLGIVTSASTSSVNPSTITIHYSTVYRSKLIYSKA